MQTQVQRPQKQGGLYSLQLGQNNGPYLAKDVMSTNQKSMNLLLQNNEISAKNQSSMLANIGQNTLLKSAKSLGGTNLSLTNQGLKGSPFTQNALELDEPADYYDQKLQAYTNYDEKYKAKSNAAENLNINSGFLNDGVEQLRKNFKFYQDQIASYRKDLENMHEQIHNSNMNNIREIQPMLKDFHQRLKDNLHKAKNENYKLQRELEQLNREKLQIQQQILFSHKRIMDLEKAVGVNKGEEEPVKGEMEEEEDEDEVSDFDND